MEWFVGIGLSIAFIVGVYFIVEHFVAPKKKPKPEPEPEPVKKDESGTFGHPFNVVESVKNYLVERPDSLQYRIEVKTADERAMSEVDVDADDLLLTVTLLDPSDNVAIGVKSVNISRYKVNSSDIMKPMVDFAEKIKVGLYEYGMAQVESNDSYSYGYSRRDWDRPEKIEKALLSQYNSLITQMRSSIKKAIEKPEVLTADVLHVTYLEAYRQDFNGTEKRAERNILKPFQPWSEKIVSEYRYMQDISKSQIEWV